MFELTDYVQFFVSGASTGCIYVLVALGIITIFNVTQVINLAQGEFLMLGAMFAVMFQGVNLPMPLSALFSVALVALVGAAVYRITIQPSQGASDVTLVMITVGTAIALRGLALLVWGTMPKSMREFSPGAPLDIFGAVLGRQRLWIMGTALLLMLMLFAFFRYTLLGKAVRACAINRQIATLAGVDADRMAMLAYALSAAMAAAAGIVVAPLTLVTYDMGVALGLKGFVAAIMGGMTSSVAAVTGGILLGVLESFASGLLSSGLKDAVAFVVLFIVLFGRTIDWGALRGRQS